MKRIKTATCKNEIFIIPSFGFIKLKEYKGLYKERNAWQLCFAWLIWRVAIRIWTAKEWSIPI